MPKTPVPVITRSPNAAPADSEEAMQLAAFEVREDAGSGYATSSSMTVSHIATLTDANPGGAARLLEFRNSL